MKLIELLEAVTALRGQQYATDTLVGWANEIEGQVIDEVVNMAEGFDLEFIPMEYGVDDDRELTVPDRFQDVYINYLLSKIDFNNQETERYNNDVVMFNSSYDAFAGWFRRKHIPKKGKSFTKF